MPFPIVSSEWYEKQRALEVHNASREQQRSTNTTTFDEKGNISFVDRSQTKGTLQENIKENIKGWRLHCCKWSQEVGRVYLSEKGLTTRKRSLELYEILCKHLNLIQIYMYGVAYVTQNITGIAAITTSLKSVIDTEHVVKEKVEERIKEIFPLALKYLDGH